MSADAVAFIGPGLALWKILKVSVFNLPSEQIVFIVVIVGGGGRLMREKLVNGEVCFSASGDFNICLVIESKKSNVMAHLFLERFRLKQRVRVLV